MTNKEAIEKFFIQREGEDVLHELYNLDLFDSGLIDSLDVIELIVYIEKHTGVLLKLSDSETFDAFHSASQLVDLISRKQQNNL
jgi:D-alanine--poly(phosphoribitol) ligase subunit 2